VLVEIQHEITFEEALVSRILASRHFTKAPLLSAFLRYICRRSLRDGAGRISEQEIGINVFGREQGYDSREDNIVRNYARQLRRRLDDYYAADGLGERLRIQIPTGGYVPLFLDTDKAIPQESSGWVEKGISVAKEITPEITVENKVPLRRDDRASWPWMLATAALAIALGVASIKLWSTHTLPPKVVRAESSYNHALWAELFSANRDTLIVPADTAFVTYEDMNERTYSLSEYVSWSSVEHPVSSFSMDLRTRKYTSVVGLEVVSDLARLPEWRSDRASVRTSRNLRVDDLKDDNLILLGSAYSIPWIELLGNEMSFKFVYKPKKGRAWIENRNPAAGEATTYINHWSGVDETDYGVIAMLPNLNRTGHILILEGLDGAGTDAAKGILFHSNLLQSLVAKSRRADGTLGGFEALLESTSVDAHSTGTHIVAVHTFS
jgi:hypothetical protein